MATVEEFHLTLHFPSKRRPPRHGEGACFGTYVEKQTVEPLEISVVFLRNVLITTDLSAHSLAALEYAFTFGLLFGARMSLLYVVEHGHHKGEHQGVVDLADFVAHQVDSRMQVEQVVRSGRAEAEIRRFAQEEGMNLIVMATHGRSGLKHAVMGSVAQKVVRLSTVPVLAVRPRQVRESILRFEDIENELHLR